MRARSEVYTQSHFCWAPALAAVALGLGPFGNVQLCKKIAQLAYRPQDSLHTYTFIILLIFRVVKTIFCFQSFRDTWACSSCLGFPSFLQFHFYIFGNWCTFLWKQNLEISLTSGTSIFSKRINSLNLINYYFCLFVGFHFLCLFLFAFSIRFYIGFYLVVLFFGGGFCPPHPPFLRFFFYRGLRPRTPIFFSFFYFIFFRGLHPRSPVFPPFTTWWIPNTFFKSLCMFGDLWTHSCPISEIAFKCIFGNLGIYNQSFKI